MFYNRRFLSAKSATMAAAQCCTEAIHILWEVLNLVAQGEIEKETVKHWMDRSNVNLQEVTTLTERRRVSEGMSKAAVSHLMLMRANLKLCKDLQTQSHINAAGPLQHQQEPQIEHQEQEPLQQEQHQTEQQLQQQQQQQQEDHINQNMAMKFENSFAVASSLPEIPDKILIEIGAATSTSSTPTVSPTKNKRELSTNSITITTSNKSTVTSPVKRQKVDSTTEDDSNNNETTEDYSNNNQTDRFLS